MYSLNSNRGMFLETLINQTALYYQAQDICMIFKRFLPISIYKRDGNNIVGHLQAKSESDYYGVYKGRMIDFEAKQTAFDYFLMGNLKKHQWEHLFKVKQFGGLTFLLVHFVHVDKFYIVEIDQLEAFRNKTKFTYEWCANNCFELHIIFPGILNLEEYFKLKVI